MQSNRLDIVQGDITKQQVDAIVNAANSSLIPGGGVDAAINRAAGPRLRQESATLGGCPTGEARLASGYDLPARWVIHTVGPVWSGGSNGEAEALARCYRSVFEIVKQRGIRTVAFPSISTGVYGFPINLAARIALREIKAFLDHDDEVHQVVVVCFSQGDYDTYQTALGEVF